MEELKYTLITGATGGLGKAFTKECAKLGQNLILTATNQDRLDELKKETLKKFNIKIITKSCDLSNYNDICDFVNFLDANKLQIENFISNAGFITEGSIQYAQTDTLIKCIKVNCEGIVHLTKKILDRKPPKVKMRILSVTSMAGEYSMPYMAIYSATKSMLTSFMTSLGIEYKKDNVRVLIVKPGAIATTQEMKDAINAQGLKGKLSSIDPNTIASKSLRLLFKTHKKSYIPGFFNKLTIFSSALFSKNCKAKIAGKMWKKSQEKRNIK